MINLKKLEKILDEIYFCHNPGGDLSLFHTVDDCMCGFTISGTKHFETGIDGSGNMFTIIKNVPDFKTYTTFKILNFEPLQMEETVRKFPQSINELSDLRKFLKGLYADKILYYDDEDLTIKNQLKYIIQKYKKYE